MQRIKAGDIIKAIKASGVMYSPILVLFLGKNGS
jgi:hypothetical protein